MLDNCLIVNNSMGEDEYARSIDSILEFIENK